MLNGLSHPELLDLGVHLFDIGAFAEAEPLLRRSIEGQGRGAACWRHLAAVVRESKGPAAALPLLRRAVEIDPRDAGLRSFLAALLAGAGAYERAAVEGQRSMGLWRSA